MTTRYVGPLNRYFYFSMSLLIAVIVVYGFSHTIDHNLLHATPRRPWILSLHAVVFSGWVIFLLCSRRWFGHIMCACIERSGGLVPHWAR